MALTVTNYGYWALFGIQPIRAGVRRRSRFMRSHRIFLELFSQGKLKIDCSGYSHFLAGPSFKRRTSSANKRKFLGILRASFLGGAFLGIPCVYGP